MHCVVKESFLTLHHLHELLSLSSESVNILVWQDDRLDHSTSSLRRARRETTASVVGNGSSLGSCRAQSVLGRSSSPFLRLLWLSGRRYSLGRARAVGFIYFLSNKLVGQDTLLRRLRLQLCVILRLFLLSNLGLHRWSAITVVHVLSRVLRVVVSLLCNLNTYGL